MGSSVVSRASSLHGLATDLISKLEGLSGPDREVDALVAVWAYPRLAGLRPSGMGGWHDPEWGLIAPPSAFTASIDSAVALIEEKLPGCWLTMGTREPWANIWREENTLVASGKAKTLPIALLIALLRALEGGE